MPSRTVVSPWRYKPWWCQPWSILLTGSGLIFTTWQLSHRLWLTGLVATPVLVWMGYFLLIWPRLMQQVLMPASERETLEPGTPEQSSPQPPDKAQD